MRCFVYNFVALFLGLGQDDEPPHGADGKEAAWVQTMLAAGKEVVAGGEGKKEGGELHFSEYVDKDSTYECWAVKMGNKDGTFSIGLWQKRYLILKRDQLCYYEKRPTDSSKPRGVVRSPLLKHLILLS